MLIALSAPQYDLAGALLLSVRSGDYLGETSRRVARTATLDGGAALEDRGYSDADRTLQFAAPNTTLEAYRQALYLQQTYPRLSLSTPEGVFDVALERVSMDRSELNLTLLVAAHLIAAA